jgi:hypothetical protein
MALFKVQVRKATNDAGGAFKWSNTHYVETLSPSTAAFTGIQIWMEAERFFHRSRVFCYEVYASSVVEGDNAYHIEALDSESQPGLFAGAGDQLPLFNVLRVDLNTAAGGRPSRKFYRPTLEEGDQTNGIITNTAYLAALQNGLVDLINIPGVRDESGNSFASATIKGITARRLGKFAAVAVPPAPAV